MLIKIVELISLHLLKFQCGQQCPVDVPVPTAILFATAMAIARRGRSTTFIVTHMCASHWFAFDPGTVQYLWFIPFHSTREMHKYMGSGWCAVFRMIATEPGWTGFWTKRINRPEFRSLSKWNASATCVSKFLLANLKCEILHFICRVQCAGGCGYGCERGLLRIVDALPRLHDVLYYAVCPTHRFSFVVDPFAFISMVFCV